MLNTLSRALALAPNLISVLATVTSPLSAAQCKAVFFHYSTWKDGIDTDMHKFLCI